MNANAGVDITASSDAETNAAAKNPLEPTQRSPPFGPFPTRGTEGVLHRLSGCRVDAAALRRAPIRSLETPGEGRHPEDVTLVAAKTIGGR
jgi:hypothetical protein